MSSCPFCRFLARLAADCGCFQWRWDGVNGDNALWLGSSKAGLRVFPKGDEDLVKPPAIPSYESFDF